MRRTTLVMGMALGLGGGSFLTGCEVINGVLAALAELDLLGVMPAEGFSDPASADYGKVKLAIAGRDDLGIPVAPPGEDIEVVPDDGQQVDEGEWEEQPGHDQGSFVLLVDGSASMEATYTCDDCPTDPNRLRVEATKALAQELGACGGDWTTSLMEFGSGTTSPGFAATQVLSDWSDDTELLVEAADLLGSYAGTPLWDGTYEVLTDLDEVANATFAESKDPFARGIVVMSDGEDTMSERTLDDVIAHALDLGIAVNTIGFGPASDSADSANSAAVDGLRRLADETGGYYGYVDSVDDLPALTTAIAGAQCGGHTELEATFTEPAPSGEMVTGQVQLKGTPIGVPFTFRAP